MDILLKRISIGLVVVACIWFVFGTTDAQAADPPATLCQVTTSTYDSWHPSWHPNGRWIVYQRKGPDWSYADIYKIRADGTGNTRLTDGRYYCSSKPSFSPNGRRIVFQRYRYTEGQVGWGCRSTIWVMNADGSNQRQVRRFDRNDRGGARWPFWSADGRFISYWGGGDSGYTPGLYAIRPSGKDKRRLTRITFGEQPHMYVDWKPAPMGRRARKWKSNQVLVSLQEPVNNYRNIAKYNLRRHRTRWLTNPNDDTCQWAQRWSPNGKRILYTDDTNNRADIWVMDANGSNKCRLTNSAATGACYSMPNWSPDGRYIVYWSNHWNPGQWDKRIYVMTADGQHKLCIMNDDSLYNWWGNYCLSFNPQGTKILFQGYDGSTDQIYVLNLDTNWQEALLGTSP